MRTGAVAMVFGTRPELVKLAPLLWKIGPVAHLIHTGQHPSESLVEILDDLGVAPPERSGHASGTPRGRQIGEAVATTTEALIACAPDVVVVQGDTNSTLAGALAADSLDLPLVHVEAGLRAFDRALPEERNRIVVDHLADLACAPTTTARDNLLREGIEADRIVITGNTVVDAARRCLPEPVARAAITSRFAVHRGEYALATFHRPENVDDPHRLQAIIDELAQLPLPVLLPVHPRTADRARAAGVELSVGALRAIAPVGFREFLALEADSAFIVTDSGGVQEEASIVGRPAIVVRRSTERPEGLGTVATLVSAGPTIGTTARAFLADLDAIHQRLSGLACPYGDGQSGPRTIAAITAFIGRTDPNSARYDAPRGPSADSAPRR